MRSLPEQLTLLDGRIRGAPPGDFSPGLQIYRHAYRARLERALAVHYPILARVMGAEAFGKLASAYATQFPSRHWSIRWHGEHLDQMLSPGPLAELARMEWALCAAFDAEDEPTVDSEALMRVPPERWSSLAFALHPAVRVLLLDWTVEKTWSSARKNAEGPWTEPERQRHALVVWRAGFDPHFRSATEGEGEALLLLHEHRSLEAAGTHLSRRDARALGAWFAGWVKQGLLVSPDRRR